VPLLLIMLALHLNLNNELSPTGHLGRYFSDGIDIYFENVGGEMMEAALADMNTYGRVALPASSPSTRGPGGAWCFVLLQAAPTRPSG